jgi:ParB/RepB/Spo0J family partition protein
MAEPKTILAPLGQIDDNPYQTRQTYDQAGIVELAEDIERMLAARPSTKGLIHVPVGRMVGGRVQLGVGHRRKRAFDYLHAQHGDGWGHMPLELADLSDEQMMAMAWSENSQREDVSAIEKALAIKRAMDEFGYSLAQVGERWGLSKSAVSNKLRLLSLPDEAQQAIQAGHIGERQGRALLSALGKSESIYQRAAADILPIAVAPDVAEKAKALVGDGNIHWYEMVRIEGETCDVCGVSSTRLYVCHPHGSQRKLCVPCYRAATGWSPPKAAEAEEIVQRVVNRESKRLESADFPQDADVGAGHPDVRAALCTECPAREMRNGSAWCLDSACYKFKTEAWFGYLVSQLRERLAQDFGDAGWQAQAHQGYSGSDLSRYDTTDAAMVRERHCAPGCARLRFRYVTYQGGAYIRPFDDLPFVYNCDNSSSHKACGRRFEASHRSEEQVAKEAAEKKATENRRRQGRALVHRAEVSLAKALEAGNPGAWRALAVALNAKPVGKDQSQDLAALRQAVAAAMFDGAREIQMVTWQNESAMEAFTGLVAGKLKRWGVKLLPCTDDLVSRLERLSEFLVDVNRGERELTREMITGNLENLNKIEADVGWGYADKILSFQDYERLLGWIAELREQFEAFSQEKREPRYERLVLRKGDDDHA